MSCMQHRAVPDLGWGRSALPGGRSGAARRCRPKMNKFVPGTVHLGRGYSIPSAATAVTPAAIKATAAKTSAAAPGAAAGAPCASGRVRVDVRSALPSAIVDPDPGSTVILAKCLSSLGGSSENPDSVRHNQRQRYSNEDKPAHSVSPSENGENHV